MFQEFTTYFQNSSVIIILAHRQDNKALGETFFFFDFNTIFKTVRKTSIFQECKDDLMLLPVGFTSKQQQKLPG